MGMNYISLSEALFTKTQQRVLGILFGNPDRSFYANEIVRATGGGVGAIQRELDKLLAAGLVKSHAVGNQKHYQANRGSPIFNELRGIVLKTFGMTDILRDALQPLAGSIQTAFIYGSIAKGNDTAESDIDVMIVSAELAYADIFPVLTDVEQRLGRSVNPTVFKPAELKRKLSSDNAFVRRVLDQPKIFLIGSEDDIKATRQSG
jgi:predicted nucleotidyltransferase